MDQRLVSPFSFITYVLIAVSELHSGICYHFSTSAKEIALIILKNCFLGKFLGIFDMNFSIDMINSWGFDWN